MPDLSLADKIRNKLDSHLLPTEEPWKTWAGYGQGMPCAGCDTPILKAQVEYELIMEDETRFRLHIGCHGLWVAERHRSR